VLDEGQVKADQLKAMFNVGDLVKAVVIRKNEEKKRISLSIKPSHFEDDEESEEEDDAMEVSSSSKKSTGTCKHD